MSKHVPIKVIQGPYQVYQGLFSLEFHRHPYSTLGFEIILLSLSLSRSLSRSLVPSRAD